MRGTVNLTLSLDGLNAQLSAQQIADLVEASLEAYLSAIEYGQEVPASLYSDASRPEIRAHVVSAAICR